MVPVGLQARLLREACYVKPSKVKKAVKHEMLNKLTKKEHENVFEKVS